MQYELSISEFPSQSCFRSMMKSFKLRRAAAPRLTVQHRAPLAGRVLQILQLFGDPAPLAAG
jgi:hypothetical protein